MLIVWRIVDGFVIKFYPRQSVAYSSVKKIVVVVALVHDGLFLVAPLVALVTTVAAAKRIGFICAPFWIGLSNEKRRGDHAQKTSYSLEKLDQFILPTNEMSFTPLKQIALAQDLRSVYVLL